MGRFLKNPDLAPGSTAARLPMVPSSSYGDAPLSGLIRFNQDSNRIEFYYNNAWNQVAKIGAVQLVVDNFTGDGTTQTFTMTQVETDPTAIAVFVGGVYQQPTSNYLVGIQAGYPTSTAYSINFTSPPPAPGVNPNQIVIIHNINSTNVPA
jgi:hypothetical protein